MHDPKLLKNKFIKQYKELSRLLDLSSVSREEKEEILSVSFLKLYATQLEKKDPKNALDLPLEDHLIHESIAYRRRVQPRKALALFLKFALFSSIAAWLIFRFFLKSAYTDFTMGLALFCIGIFHLECNWTPLAKHKKSTLFYRVLAVILVLSSFVIMVANLLGFSP